MQFAVLAEDRSDAETLSLLIKRIRNNNGLRVKWKGFGGSGDLFRNGAKDINLFHTAHNCTHFVVCHDADDGNVDDRRKRIVDTIIKPSGIEAKFCALVPVQEIEAWFLSDLVAVKSVFNGIDSNRHVGRPEDVKDPKENLVGLVRRAKSQPRYITSIHNPKIAEYLNIGVVRKKCPSFEPFYDFAFRGSPNV